MPKDTHSSTQESDFIKIDNLVSTAFLLQYKVYEGLEFPKIKFGTTRLNLLLKKMFLGWKCLENEYFKVATCNTCCLEAHAGFFRLLMKGILNSYCTKTFWQKVDFPTKVGWPLKISWQNSTPPILHIFSSNFCSFWERKEKEILLGRDWNPQPVDQKPIVLTVTPNFLALFIFWRL